MGHYLLLRRRRINTGYCRAIEQACRDLLGLEYTEENAQAIGRKLKELKGKDPAAFVSRILQEKAGIQWVIQDTISTPEEISNEQYLPFFRVNYRDDPYRRIHPGKKRRR